MLRKIFLYFANLKFAILLLLFLAGISSIGSLIEQNREDIFYKEQYRTLILNIPFWKIILRLGLNTIYTNSWFLFTLCLLGFSLICCTFSQQLPTLKFSRRYYFYKRPKQFQKLVFSSKQNSVLKSHLSYNLLNKQYSLFYKKNTLYAYKGLISRLGPVIVHLSLICILFGSMLGSLKGFTAQELIPKTEIFHVQNIIKYGMLSEIPQKTFRINDFWFTYNSNNEISQYYSDISALTSHGLEVKRKTISVNNPLLIDRLTIYQTDWGISGIRLKFENAMSLDSSINIQLPVLKVPNLKEKIWVSSLPPFAENKESFIVLIKNNRGQVNLFNTSGQFLKTINLGESNSLTKTSNFEFRDIIASTGIQIKSDPGIGIIYFGFLFLILSSLISYLAFSEFWLLVDQKVALLGARTNRAKVFLNTEFLKVEQSLLKK